MAERQPAVRMRDISKSFGQIQANSAVSLDIYRGEILALLGENGSGKTTLMNMLSGIYFPDSGEIEIDGEPVVIASPKDAFDKGIGMIHQHFKLVNVFTAAENIILGLEDEDAFDIAAACGRIRAICDSYGFDVDPDQKVYDMSVSQKQTVEIVKLLYRGADILILDEPTAVLTPQETDRLFAILRNMRDDGKAIVIITHKLREVLDISDRVAVLRKGAYVGAMATAETSPQEMTNMMVGHQVSLNIDRPAPVDPKERIRVSGVTVRNQEGVVKLDNVSFTARSGEILGIAGISGCGQKELLEAIAGLQPVEVGSIEYIHDNGRSEQLIGKDPLEIAALGVALSFVPEDRLGMGLVGNMDLTDNMMLRSFRQGRGIFTDRKGPRHLAEKVVEELEVSTDSISTPVRKLSGGNVQKVLVGREISSSPTVLLSAYAVRGLDVNSSYLIYDLINQQKERGVAVVYVGEDLDVLLEFCDRILVLCGGKVSGIVDGRGATKNEVGLMMTKLGGEEA
ncbi:ABC transporter ATP-binding protein [Coriobacteriales bacterium OH1046]|nr:ABC transporter ATP-binding protein [Coriobacteriales bacterium OH1046]